MSPKPIQALIILAPIILFGWLAWQDFVPTGVAVVSHLAGAPSSVFDPIRPDQRVVRTGNDVLVIGDPVYTFIHPWQNFNQLQLQIEFHDDGVPIIEAGGLTQTNPEAYTFEPMQNLLIDQSTWNRMDENGLVLLQRMPTYASVSDFLAHPPAGNKIAFYRYTGALPGGVKRLLPSLDLDAAGIDYVIAQYTTPRTDGKWSVATVSFDPSMLLEQSNAWKIVFSAPGAALGGPSLTIHSITATFHGAVLSPLFSNLGL